MWLALARLLVLHHEDLLDATVLQIVQLLDGVLGAVDQVEQRIAQRPPGHKDVL